MSPKSDFNANSDHDLAERLRRIEDLPIERDIKNILSMGEIVADWLDSLAQIVAEQALDLIVKDALQNPMTPPKAPEVKPKFPTIFRTCQPFHDDPDYDDQ